MEALEAGESPGYDEIQRKYGEKVSIDEALRRTSTLQDRYPELGAIGSVLGSSELYGEKEDFRTTSKGLDFIASKDVVQRIAEEQDDDWTYEGSYVFDEDGWMNAVIPSETSVFQNEELNDFLVYEDDVEEFNKLGTSYGEINAVPAELGITSKLRRYIMQKENRGSFKSGDLIDIANISLANQHSSEIYQYDELKNYTDRFIAEEPYFNGFVEDALESIENSNDVPELEPIEKITVTEELEELKEALE